MSTLNQMRRNSSSSPLCVAALATAGSGEIISLWHRPLIVGSQVSRVKELVSAIT